MTEQELLQKADAVIDANINQIVQDIKTIVDSPSVKSAPQPGAPFGTEIRRALTAALGIAERMGFHTVNCDDYGAMRSWRESVQSTSEPLRTWMWSLREMAGTQTRMI